MRTTRLRNLAADADTDVVHGRSTKCEMFAFFAERE